MTRTHEFQPASGQLTPPGYYVDSSADGSGGPCLHCGAGGDEHEGELQFCPTLPMEVRACA